MSENQTPVREDWLSQFGLDMGLVLKAVVIAVVSGILAALLDEILGLPADALFVTAGGMVGALNGATYACFKRCYDRSGLAAGIVMGWLATMIWFFTLQIVAGDSSLIAGLDWFEVTITGLVAGAAGFGWFSAVHALP
jgi:hypothetical protein